MRRWLAGLAVKATELRWVPEWLTAPLMDITFGNLLKEGYRKNSAVYACVRTHALAFPEPPLVVRSPGPHGLAVDPAHPLTRLMRRPNPHMGQAEFWSFVVTYMAVGGNCYVWKSRSKVGRPVELWPLHDGQMQPVLDGKQWIGGYRFDDGTAQGLRVPADDVVHLRWAPDPKQPQLGLSPVVAVAREVDTDNEAGRYVHALLRNDATPRTLVTIKGQLRDDAFKRLKEQFKERYGGNNRGDVAVIDGQEMSVQRLGLNLNELADAALRTIPESRIAAAMEVPAILAGLNTGLERATFANANALREFYTETTLVPRWRLVADQFQALMLPEYGDPGERECGFDLSTVRALQEDEDRRWKRYDSAVRGGWMRVNEARVRVGLDAVDGGDSFLPPRPAVLTLATGDAAPEPGPATEPAAKALPPPTAPAPPAESDGRLHRDAD